MTLFQLIQDWSASHNNVLNNDLQERLYLAITNNYSITPLSMDANHLYARVSFGSNGEYGLIRDMINREDSRKVLKNFAVYNGYNVTESTIDECLDMLLDLED